MHSHNAIEIRSRFDPLFARAADIARWPEFLPHYRWVKILDRQGNRVIAEMAARHWGLPLWWKTVQVALPQERRIRFTHIGGLTRGMEVEWRFAPITQDVIPAEAGNQEHVEGWIPAYDRGNDGQETWLVQIHHVFHPSWPLIGPWLAHRVIGRMFVQEVAGKTLGCLKKTMEASA